MRYLIALIWPPLAVTLSASTKQAVLNALLWFGALILIAQVPWLAFALWAASLAHALMAVSGYYQKRRQEELVEVMHAAKVGAEAAFEQAQANGPKDVYKL